MRHAIVLHDLRLQLLLEKMLAHQDMVAYQAGSHMGEHCGTFPTSQALIEHIQQSTARGLMTLHYVLHAPKLGGEAKRRRVRSDLMEREEMEGEGLIHLYLQAQGPHGWLLRMEVPRCTPAMQLAGWHEKALEEEGFRLGRLMRVFGQSADSSPHVHYLRGTPSA